MINTSCHYCPCCDLLSAHQYELEAHTALLHTQHAPERVGSNYLVMGTLDLTVWKRGQTRPLLVTEMIEQLHDLVRVMKLERSGIYPAGSIPWRCAMNIEDIPNIPDRDERFVAITVDCYDLERASLDRPSGFDTDWGGDGSDLMRPVRAHVLAALPSSAGPYPPPLDALVTLGDEDVDDLVTARGIGQEHVPELVRMVRDRALVTAPADAPASWAPFHALEILSELDFSAHVADLITLFDTDLSELTDELLWKLGGVGGVAVAPLVAYMNDRTRWDGGRSYAANALEEIGNQLPDTRDAVVAAISALVENGAGEREGLMGMFVSALIGLKAVETLPIIRRAFAHGWIDETVPGSWGTVLNELGVTPDPNDPLVEESRQRFEERHARMFPHAPFGRAQATPSQRPASTQKPRSDQARKEKNKRKVAKASRKANRKKRK